MIIYSIALAAFCKFQGQGANPVQGFIYIKRSLSVAKECLLVALKADPKATSVWVNLANAYYMASEHKNSKRCLEKVIDVFISFP
jgi:tetratricopeptide (TPR) repeat protein